MADGKILIGELPAEDRITAPGDEELIFPPGMRFELTSALSAFHYATRAHAAHPEQERFRVALSRSWARLCVEIMDPSGMAEALKQLTVRIEGLAPSRVPSLPTDDIRGIVRQEAVRVIASDLEDPNGALARAVSRMTPSDRRR